MPITKAQTLTGLALGAACLVAGVAIARPPAPQEMPINSHEDARAALIDERDLPSGWHVERRPEVNDTTALFSDGLSPVSCANAWRVLDDINATWAAAPVDVRVAFASPTADAYLSEQIAHDAGLDLVEFMAAIEQMVDECGNYIYIGDDGTAYSGTVERSDLGQSDDGIGIEQTWTGPGGASSTAYFAYVPSDHTIMALRGVSGAPGALTPGEFTTAVHTATAALGVR